MENSALKVAVREYLELLVTACNLRVQADEATKLVTQLSKTKGSQDEVKANRIRYTSLYAQWENTMKSVKVAHQNAVGLKEECLDDNVSIPSFEFLEGKKRNNDRALRLVELRAQLATISADSNSGDTGTNVDGVASVGRIAPAEGVDSAAKNDFADAAPIVSTPLAELVGSAVPTVGPGSLTTGSAMKEVNTTKLTSITVETSVLGMAAPSFPSATATVDGTAPAPAIPAPQAAHASSPPDPPAPTKLLPELPIPADHPVPNSLDSVRPPVPNSPSSVRAPPIPSVHVSPEPQALIERSFTPAMGTSMPQRPGEAPQTAPPATYSHVPQTLIGYPQNAALPVRNAQPHAASPAPYTQHPIVITPTPALNSNGIPSHIPVVDAGSGSTATMSTSDVHGPSGAGVVNTTSNFSGWDQIGTRGAAFGGGYSYSRDEGLAGPSSSSDRQRMTTLLGDDFVFNDMLLPGNHNHPGLSFDSVYNSFEDVPTADLVPDKPSHKPESSVPIKRSSELDNDDRPAKKAGKKDRHPTLPDASGGTSSLAPHPTTAEDGDSKKKGSGKKKRTKKEVDEVDDDDNEVELAEASKKGAKAPIVLLPQEIPPFKLYVEPPNPLDFSSMKHRTIDLPITYMLPKDLPVKVKNRPSMWFGMKKGKFELVSDEWDTYLKDGTPISARSKNLITKYAAILPRALTYSREVALYILTTDHGNVICPYHRWVSKKPENDVQFETQRPNHYFVTGVPGISRIKRVVKSVQEVVSKVGEVVKSFATGNEPRPPTPPKEDAKTAEDSKPLEREPGKLHCGCIEDEVLLELILWKSTLQQSPATGIIETWQDTFFNPRDRTFALRAYTYWTGLKADHLYEFDANGKRRSMIDITKYQCAFFRKRLRELERREKDVSGIIPDFDKLEVISFDDDEEGDDNDDDNDDDKGEGEDEGDGGDDGNEDPRKDSDDNEDDENVNMN
ncbi:hypothetical protein NP233_g5047 [Leucocoprinus birnbaumii]|uniref:Uncharacterized protein n=1 Tax=Leucocoprinus birnbaumii TaxID=56174 RepID=A0AAD5VU17_9AGAR|nr:hypothetical protein NP233_g5047 [Leucocoprinus birnbaumii]